MCGGHVRYSTIQIIIIYRVFVRDIGLCTVSHKKENLESSSQLYLQMDIACCTTTSVNFVPSYHVTYAQM